MDHNKVCLFGLTASNDLAEKIAKELHYERDVMDIVRFADGEILARSQSSVRGKEVFIVQSTSNPVNENLMELLIAIDALKRGSAEKIYTIIPYFGYARQDRKAKGRQPITCKLVANLITKAGADAVMTVDIHSPQSMGFFDVPMDNLKTIQVFSKYILKLIKEKHMNDKITLVSPDHGGLTRVRDLADSIAELEPSVAVIDKRRPKPNVSEIEFILGDVNDKVCFIIDDMIDTAGTICNAARAIKKEGAKAVYIIACHGVFSYPATERLEAVVNDKIVERVIVTDTIQIPDDKKFKGLEVITVAPLIADVIEAIADRRSLSAIYESHTQAIKKQLSTFKK